MGRIAGVLTCVVALGCGPEADDDRLEDEEVCGLENLRSSLELHLDGQVCEDCPASDDLQLMARLETDCPGGVTWWEPCIILVDHLIWRVDGGAEDAHFYSLCSEALYDPLVLPAEPLEYRLGDLPSITGAPVQRGVYGFAAYFVRKEIPRAEASFRVGGW